MALVFRRIIDIFDFFFENSIDLLIIINITSVQITQKVTKNTNGYLGHLATTIDTSMSRRRAAILAHPSLEPEKDCRSRACYRPPKNQRTRAATITNDDNHRSEKNDL
jgi:hypothetical protein